MKEIRVKNQSWISSEEFIITLDLLERDSVATQQKLQLTHC